jgi:hypothetical protein
MSRPSAKTPNSLAWAYPQLLYLRFVFKSQLCVS